MKEKKVTLSDTGITYENEMQPLDYLKNHVKFYLKTSPTHGIGLFALVDIKKGEDIFKPWEGETGIYSITYKQARSMPKVLSFVLKLFSNQIKDDGSKIHFKLVKDANFIFTQPLCMMNTLYEYGNVDYQTGVALRDIKEDEELFGNYGLSSQVKTTI